MQFFPRSPLPSLEHPKHPRIMELDINPLLVHARGHNATAADCKINLKKAGRGDGE